MMRKATHKDINDLTMLLEAWLEESPDHIKDFHPEKVRETISFLLDTGVIFVHTNVDDRPVAFLAGTLTATFTSFRKVAVETAWWVAPAYRSKGIGKELIEAFEAWGKEMGVDKFILCSIASSPPEVEKLYLKLGYKELEKSYAKDI